MRTKFGDERDIIVERASDSRVKCRVEEFTQPDEDITRHRLFLDFPHGRETSTIRVTALRAQQLLESNFEHWTLLGDFVAVLDTSTGSIEAAIRQTRPMTRRDFRQLPGVRRRNTKPGNLQGEGTGVAQSQAELDVEAIESEYLFEEKAEADYDWMLEITVGEARKIELSPASAALYVLDEARGSWWFRANDRRLLPPSLKIHGISDSGHDDALKILERYSAAFFFELDLRYDFPLSLHRPRELQRSLATRRHRRLEASEPSPMAVIRNVYAESAVTLYFYGRSARGLPLLQYLAYYQAIEYFYPSFSNAEMLRRIRAQLKDPRFNPDNDRSLQKMISLAQTGGRLSAEREQLRMVLEACVEEADLLEFLTSDKEIEGHFTGKDQIRDVNPIRTKGGNNPRLVHQIADRVYSIRCRIVHTKEGGGSTDIDALLPFGREADALEFDILLMQFLVQKVIIAASRGTL